MLHWAIAEGGRMGACWFRSSSCSMTSCCWTKAMSPTSARRRTRCAALILTGAKRSQGIVRWPSPGEGGWARATHGPQQLPRAQRGWKCGRASQRDARRRNEAPPNVPPAQTLPVPRGKTARVCLLGQVAYFGGLGFCCPMTWNPADYFMDLVVRPPPCPPWQPPRGGCAGAATLPR